MNSGMKLENGRVKAADLKCFKHTFSVRRVFRDSLRVDAVSQWCMVLCVIQLVLVWLLGLFLGFQLQSNRRDMNNSKASSSEVPPLLLLLLRHVSLHLEQLQRAPPPQRGQLWSVPTHPRSFLFLIRVSEPSGGHVHTVMYRLCMLSEATVKWKCGVMIYFSVVTLIDWWTQTLPPIMHQEKNVCASAVRTVFLRGKIYFQQYNQQNIAAAYRWWKQRQQNSKLITRTGN